MRNLISIQRPELSLPQILSALFGGLIISVVVIFVVVSFAAMLFSGELDSFVSVGIGLCLMGTFIYGLFSVLTSTFTNTISLVQDAPIAILAVLIASIVTQMSSATPEEKLATAVGVIMLTSILTGIFFWILGHFNLGRLVRFVPYPVIGGFLAGTGLLLIIGGIKVMVDVSFGMALFSPEVLVRWLPGFAFGIALVVLLRFYSSAWLMPVCLIAGVALFYLIYFLINGPITSAATEGWLLGPFPSGRLWKPVIGLSLSQANWSLVASNAVKFSAVLLVGLISLLLNISGLEIIMGKDADLRSELKWSGLAIIIAGLSGSPMGFQALSLSALGYKLSGRTRLVGLFVTIVIGLTLLFGASMLSIFPKLIIGGLLVFIGSSLLLEWIYDAWFKLSKPDYLLIWLILIIIVTMGFLEGVAMGIVVAAIIFMINYSRTNFIHHAVTGTGYESHTVRPQLYERLLRQRGNSLLILELQGYIFFGTAHQLVEQINKHLDDTDISRLQFLIMDFRLVTGIDSSAMLSFTKLTQVVQDKDINLVLTNLSPEIKHQFEQELLSNKSFDNWHIFSTLHEGVNWCEEQLLEIFKNVGLVAKPESLVQQMRKILSPEKSDVDWLEYLKPGAKPELSAQFSTFLGYLKRVDFDIDDCILRQGDEVDGLYFLEKGKVWAHTEDSEGKLTATGMQEANTLLVDTDFYAHQPATQTFIATQPGFLYHLSANNLKRLEADHPEIAIALHRQIAGILSHKTIRATDIALALQR